MWSFEDMPRTNMADKFDIRGCNKQNDLFQ
jgi:hypothetical protein